MNIENILVIVTFVTILFFFLGLYKTMLEKKIKAREFIEQNIAPDSGKAQSSALLREQEEVVLKRRKKNEGEDSDFLSKLETQLEQANLRIRTNEFILLAAAIGVFCFILLKFLFGLGLLLSVALGVGATVLTFQVVKLLVMLRMGKAAAQFADILDALVNCFKTGLGFSRAIQRIADNFEDPWGTEFAKMAAEANLGATQEMVLHNLSRRVPLPDVDLFVTALIIQKETGGNMAELLGNLSHTCRERYKLKRKVSAISAQGKLSASIVTGVPFFIMGMLYLFMPEPVTKFVTNPIGMVILGVMGVWMMIGVGVLFKMVQIEV